MQTKFLSLVLATAALSWGSGASAQTAGFAINRLDLAEAGSDWFAGDSLDMRGHLRPGVGITADYAYRPLVRYDEDGDEVAAVIEHQVLGHLGLSLMLVERLRLAAQMPVLRWGDGEPVNVNGVTFEADDGLAVGDLRLGADLRIAGQYGSPIILAIGTQLYLPTGSQDAFTGDGTARITPRLMIAGDLGLFAYSGRLAYHFRSADEGFGDVETGSEVSFVATAGLRLARRKLVIGPELWGSTVSDGDAFFGRLTTPVELVFGVHYRVAGWRIGAGAGPGLTRGLGSPTVRALASLSYMPEPDRDNDGIYDEDDACPDTPGAPSEDPAKNGCPPDRDGDGIPDSLDACPDTPGIESDDPRRHGCPDRDGDGIFDQDDACPDIPGVRSDDPKKNGCPPDRDGDGIYDYEDACPDTPGIRSDIPEQNGCPLAKIEEDEIKIYQRIEFEFDSAKLLVSSEVVLSAVLDIILHHPEIKHLLVEGHCDIVGTAEYNRELSQRRAAAVVDWLATHGIDRSRLLSAGKGFDEPIADNDTPEGRQKNRRVEFHILEFNKQAKGRQAQ